MKACQPRVRGQLTHLCLRAVASLFFACLSKDLFAEQGFFLTLLICFPFCNQLTDFKIAYFKTHTKALLHTTLFFVVQADSMPEMPPETVTEEQYTDEHGHTVVKKVLSVLPLGTFFLSCKRKEKSATEMPNFLLRRGVI